MRATPVSRGLGPDTHGSAKYWSIAPITAALTVAAVVTTSTSTSLPADDGDCGRCTLIALPPAARACVDRRRLARALRHSSSKTALTLHARSRLRVLPVPGTIRFGLRADGRRNSTFFPPVVIAV